MSVITQGYGVADPKVFTDQVTHKYFCEVVQGDVSNVLRQERSVAVTAGLELPTGSIGFIGADGKAAKTGDIPYIVFVGTEHGNVFSERGNSGCGLITMLPLFAGNDYMTTVFDGELTTFTEGVKLTYKENKIAVAGTDDPVIGVVRSAGKHHLGPNGVVFTACFSL